jgi:hypothetical protein
LLIRRGNEEIIFGIPGWCDYWRTKRPSGKTEGRVLEQRVLHGVVHYAVSLNFIDINAKGAFDDIKVLVEGQ